MDEGELRRLVAQLARSRDDDIRAILASLDSAHETRISELLAEHGWKGVKRRPRAETRKAELSEAVLIPPDLAGLPAWLAPRVEAALRGENEGTYRGATFALGPAAREALALEAKLLSPSASSQSESAGRRARSALQYLRRIRT